MQTAAVRARSSFLLPLTLLLLVFALFLPAARNGFIYDDVKIVLRHEGLHSFADLAQVFREPHFPRFPYYRPITRTTLLLQKTLHGDDPVPFHLFNAALAALTALTAFWLLRAPALRIERGPAFLAALGFGVHPLMAHCVLPICSGRET